MLYNIIILSTLFITYIIISIVDIKTFTIPLLINYISLGLLITLDLIFCKYNIIIHSIGLVFNLLLFYITRFISRNKLGLGDIHLSLLIGYANGFPSILFANIISTLLALIFYLILFLQKKNIMTTKIPFGPFMTVGSFLIYIFSLSGLLDNYHSIKGLLLYV